MTEPTKPPYMPTMDEAYRFITSNPATSAGILVETLRLSREDSAVSNGRLREIWKLLGGVVDKNGRAWIEADLLPGLLRAMPLSSAPPPARAAVASAVEISALLAIWHAAREHDELVAAGDKLAAALAIALSAQRRIEK